MCPTTTSACSVLEAACLLRVHSGDVGPKWSRYEDKEVHPPMPKNETWRGNSRRGGHYLLLDPNCTSCSVVSGHRTEGAKIANVEWR